MVQEPSFFTLAAHDVRKLRSRSVAVMESLSLPASNRKLERIGIVVLRSTTPCVAVSSFNRSFLLTLISIVVPTSVPTEEGIMCLPNIIETNLFLNTINYSSNSRCLRKSGNTVQLVSLQPLPHFCRLQF